MDRQPSPQPRRVALPARLLRADWPEQIGERLAGRDPQCPFVELLVGELPTCPSIKERLGDAGVEPLNANRSKRVRRSLLTTDSQRSRRETITRDGRASHAPIVEHVAWLDEWSLGFNHECRQTR
jgi:hypothetical protein